MKMSIVGIQRIPPKLPLRKLVRMLAHEVNGQFEAFSATHKTKSKTCYLKLSPNLDQFKVVNIINNAKFPFQLEAFLPENDVHLKVPEKTKKIPNTLRKALQIPLNLTPKQISNTTHEQILTELLSKFTLLYELSGTMNHYLLKTIWQTVHQRLEELMTQNKHDNCYSLSKCYRDNFPHSTDFTLITAIVTEHEEKMGIPRKELNERELCEYKPELPDAEEIQPQSLLNIGNKYSDRIVSKILDHIKNINNHQNKYDWATDKVRGHITSMAHLVPAIVKTIITRNLTMKAYSTRYEIVRIYGEPFLPNKQIMSPFLKKFSYVTVQRSERIYNLLTVKIPAANLMKILTFDGTHNFGTKFVIRPLNSKKHGEELKEIRKLILADNSNS